MSSQRSFTDIEYSRRRRITRREKFLKMMDELIPWGEWIELIRPHYPEGKRGRRPLGIDVMLRMYLVQIWFNLSDEMAEDAIYDSYAIRDFIGIDFYDRQAPDATTLLKFRHLLEKHGLGEKFFDSIKEMLESKGCMMHGGTIVDATIIEAPSSTKNAKGERDPEMHSTKKGNEWHFGMKAHIGVDAGSGYVHTVTATGANVHDVTEASKLIREDDEVLYGDAGYVGIEKREEMSSDEKRSKMLYRINRRGGSLKKDHKGMGYELERAEERRKSSVRCKVEHPFRIVKVIFGYSKTVYRGLKKNLHRLHMLFASANVWMWGLAGAPSR